LFSQAATSAVAPVDDRCHHDICRSTATAHGPAVSAHLAWALLQLAKTKQRRGMKLNWKTFQANRSLASASSRRGRSAGSASPRAAWVALGLALFIAASRPARAEIYRYVDADGVTVYSQSPPPAALASGARSESGSESGPESGSGSESGSESGTPTTITPDRGPSSAEVAAAQARLKQQLERDLDRREEERRLAQETAQNEARAKQRASACAAARGNLQTLQNLGSKRLRLPDGSSIRPSAEQRAQHMDEARQQIRALCD
jgi:hypothetical protein